MPIESVQTGDRVLSQNPLSGELAFKPVLDVTRGRQEFLALEMTDGNRLVATPVHVFWVAGSGWRLTKDLRVGDRLHTLSGGCQIQSIEPLPADQTFNLVVADFNTFFVGDDRVLTHDVTLPEGDAGGTPGELSLADGNIER